MKRIVSLAITLVSLVVLVASCGSAGPSATDAYAFAAQQGSDGSAFMIVSNPTTKDDALVSAKATVATRVELHTMVMDPKGGMMMQQIPSIPIAAGGKVELKRGSLHVMLFGLTKELKVGDKFPVTLHLQSGKDITAQVTVRAAN